MADLSGSFFDVVSSSLNAGDEFDVNFEVQNTGFFDASSFWVDFYLSTDIVINPFEDYYLGSYQVDQLFSGSNLLGFETLTLPNASDSFWVGDGIYTVGMVVDGDDSVFETDEGNNSNVAFLADNDDVDITIGGTAPPPVNRNPTEINLSNTIIAENQPNNSVVANLSTIDPDVGNTHTYSLVTGTGDTDNAAFTIEGNVLKAKQSFDFETRNAYSIRVRTNDGKNGTVDQQFTIQVSDVPEGETATARSPINFEPLDLKLRGDSDDNTLKGKTGNDRLRGRAGNDRLVGKSGNDLLQGQQGNDTLIGGSGNDLLNGAVGNDRLLGQIGNDVLLGGNGIDTLSGGVGKDLFVLNSLVEAGDRITDFSGAEDLIDLRAIFAASQYAGSTSFSRFTQFIQLVQTGANTEVKIDADGNGVGTTFTTLITLENLTASTINSRNFVVA